MTTIEFECPFCSRPMKVPASAAGKTGKCKSCKNSVVVPKQKTEQPAETAIQAPKKSPHRYFLMSLSATLLVSVAAGACWYWTGTRTDIHTEEDENLITFRTDKISIRTGRIVHRRITMFSKSQPLMSATIEGDMDDYGNSHGKWKYTDERDFATFRWYCHGRECSEQEFKTQVENQ